MLAPAPAAMALGDVDHVERQILRGFNAARAQAGLPRLHADRRLMRAADAHSIDMLSANFFDHLSSNGQSMLVRVSAFRPSRVVGEVIASISGWRLSAEAQPVVAMWLASPPHRATILTRRFRRVGIARRTGVLGGVRSTVLTADFASRR